MLWLRTVYTWIDQYRGIRGTIFAEPEPVPLPSAMDAHYLSNRVASTALSRSPATEYAPYRLLNASFLNSLYARTLIYLLQDRCPIKPSWVLQDSGRQDAILKLPDQLVGLLRQGQCQDGVGQDSGKMRQKSLVDGEQSFGANRLGQAVKDTLVKIAVLVVQSRHDGIWQGFSVSNTK